MISEKIANKQKFNIMDFSKIVKRKADTIRSWEEKGIIKKGRINPENKWREYTREEMCQTLKDILNYPWERDLFKDEIRNDMKEYIYRFEHPIKCSLEKKKLC